MSNTYFPHWLYELLPIVYLVAGVMALAGFDNPYGQTAGFILCCTAVLVGAMRYRARAKELSKRPVKHVR